MMIPISPEPSTVTNTLSKPLPVSLLGGSVGRGGLSTVDDGATLSMEREGISQLLAS